MKLSDYVAYFLAKQGIHHVFAISGGASLHLIHSIESVPGVDYICPQHEQAAAMAADAYSRVTWNLGAAISTSGPGATNMLTGVSGAYYDSIAVIYITGQVATFRNKKNSGVRQLGFQETDTVSIFRPITKYAVRIDNPEIIRFELEKAVYMAKSERPGPVLIDLPDDLQRKDIDPDKLRPFIPRKNVRGSTNYDEKLNRCVELINRAKRPVLIFGWGVRLAGAVKEAKHLAETLGFPVVPTWAAMDMFPYDHKLLVGSFGTHGTRFGNFAVQNSDLVLSVGARLDTRTSGSPITTFAREARKVIVDIDNSELNKFKMLGMRVDVLIKSDAKVFLAKMNERSKEISACDISDWKTRIGEWREKFPVCSKKCFNEKEVNPYVFAKTLSRISNEGEVIFVDTGCTLVWVMQGFEPKVDQRIFHDFNNTSMGYALPASIGACFALGKRPIICITGDGSLQMNIQELSTVVKHKLPIKIFLINNDGYSMIRQTQDQWMNSSYLASDAGTDLAFPDFAKLADVYGFKVFSIRENNGATKTIQEVFDHDGPAFCDVVVPARHRVMMQVKFGRPLEDSEPLLDRKEFFENMIVEPAEESLR